MKPSLQMCSTYAEMNNHQSFLRGIAAAEVLDDSSELDGNIEADGNTEPVASRAMMDRIRTDRKQPPNSTPVPIPISSAQQ